MEKKVITICGSIAFIDEMISVRDELIERGFEVLIPPTELLGENGEMITAKEYYALRQDISDENSWIWNRKKEAILTHFEKIKKSDSILVLNYDKNDISGYIGGNTLMEVGVALLLEKKIYLLKKIPEISYKEEILGCKPIVIDDDLSRIV